LQWILGHTMGSPKAFQFRKQELQRERYHEGRTNTTLPSLVSDEDVVQSYLDSCHAQTGEMSHYLNQAHVCLKLGKLCVVHGAMPWMISNPPNDYELAMPWLTKPNATPHDSLISTTPTTPAAKTMDWIHALNEFAHSQIQQWQLSSTDPPTDGVWATQGGFDYWPSDRHNYSGLLQYGMGWLPNHKRIPTVVYSSWTHAGMPRQFFDPSSREAAVTEKFMNDADLQVILSGHQPQGDLPTPIRIGHDKLVMACDTSYSGDMQWLGCAHRPPVGGRGSVAVCEVLLEQCIDTGTIHSVTNHGVLSNGMPFETKNLLENTSPDIGRLRHDAIDDTQRPWWTKADLIDGSQLCSTAEGYDVVNTIVKSR
jgi:hypothetical protein